MFIGLVAGMVAVDSQAMSVRGTNEGTIKHPTVNFVIYLVGTYQALQYRRVQSSANATSSAKWGLCPCKSFYSKTSD